MSRSLNASSTIRFDIGNLKQFFIKNEYFSDKDDDNVLDFDETDINRLEELKSTTTDIDYLTDLETLIQAIKKYQNVNIWLGW